MANKKPKMTLDRLATEMMAGFYDVSKEIGGMRGETKEIKDDVGQIKQRLTKIEYDVAEIKVDIKAHGNAIDKDALLLLNHGKRIARLEKAS